MDTLTPAQRSERMGRVKNKGSKAELLVRSLVHRLGYRFRLHRAGLPGKPDLVFPARRKVMFVHGCFWHGHTCGRGFRPASNADFWAAKIDGNKARDRRSVPALHAQGWRMLTVWECAAQPRKIKALQTRLVFFLEL